MNQIPSTGKDLKVYGSYHLYVPTVCSALVN